MYKSTPITQKCKSSPFRQTTYIAPGVNTSLIEGVNVAAEKFEDNVAVTDEDKEKQKAKEVAKAESVKPNTAPRQRNPAQQARYEGRKERQSIRQEGRAERIKDRNISRNKSVQDRVDKKNEYLNKIKKPKNVSGSKIIIDFDNITTDEY